MSTPAAVDLGPLAPILLIGALLAAAPLAWALRRGSGANPAGRRLRTLAWVTLFLTFDLVLFGAFTRLTDSGLGCPDWPGCYGSASPIGARATIDAAQGALPTGPVTIGKAWIEMAHRYLATAVGALIVLLAALSWRARRRGELGGVALRWALLTLAWVCLQGAFGAFTVTMKLYPAIVTLHLLGGIGLLALLAVQSRLVDPKRLLLAPACVSTARVVALLAIVQIALGGWVSSNYAVLACSDFPTCQGSWWPTADFVQGFSLRRPLGAAADGGWLPFAALTAIHLAHRIGAAVLLAGLAVLAWQLARQADADARKRAWPFAAVALWQIATGLGNVLLGWPLAAAVAHTGGAAVLATLLALLLAEARFGGPVTAGKPLQPLARGAAS